MTDNAAYQQQADLFIRTMSRLMGGEFERTLLTLSRGEFGVLMYLAGHTVGVTSNMISGALRIGPGGVANVLKALEKKGFVTKAHDKRDRRANCVTITPKGRELLDARYKQIRESITGFMEELGEETCDSLNQGLAKLQQVAVAREESRREEEARQEEA